MIDDFKKTPDETGAAADGDKKHGARERRFSVSADQSKVLGIFLLIILWLLCSIFLMMPPYSEDKLQLVQGQHIPKTIYAHCDFVFEDREMTVAKRAETARAVPLYFKISESKIADIAANAEKLFAAANERSAAEKGGRRFVPEADNRFAARAAELGADALTLLTQIAQDPQQKTNFFEALNLIAGRGFMGGEEKNSCRVGQKIRIIDLAGRERVAQPVGDIPDQQQAAEELSKAVLAHYPPSLRAKLQPVVTELAGLLLGPSGVLLFDETRSEEKRREAAATVAPVMVEVKKFQPLAIKNQLVTPKLLNVLKLYSELEWEQTKDAEFKEKPLQHTVWCLFLMIITGLYLYHIHPEVVKSNRKIWITAVVAFLAVATNYIFVNLYNFCSSYMEVPLGLVNYAVPLALAPILLSVMIGLRVAIYIGFLVSVLTAMMFNKSFDLVLSGLVVSCLAGFAVRYATNYRAFFLRSLIIVFLTFWLLDINFIWKLKDEPRLLLWTAGLSFANGFFTATVALIMTFIFEVVFNTSTNMSLLMLCDYGHPLLKRLQLEAPGTFHHSLMVSTMAEYAALSINANPIKARVGALFHDIGKLTKPEYYIENNFSAKTKHSELHPRMSSLIILNHVKDGIDLAARYKLRREIRDVIEQHHGTDIVYYFYRQAQEQEAAANEQDFRYPGPLPKEKEVVIVSLADACEAAARALHAPTEEKIDALVSEIFRKRIRDGQLDDADITMGELSRIRDSFVKTLTTMHHGRIAYPEEEEKNEDDLHLADAKTAAAGSDKYRTFDEQGG